MLVATHEVGGPKGRLDLVDKRQVGDAVEQLLQHDAQLEAGEAGTQAEVGTEPEGDVLVGRAPKVEGGRVGEDGLVPVGR